MERRITFFTLKEFVARQMNKQQYDGFTICHLQKNKMTDIKLYEPMRTDSFGMSIILKGSLRVRIGFSEQEIHGNMIFLHSPTTIIEFLDMDDDLEMITFMFSLDFAKKIGIFFHGKSSLDFLFDNFLRVFALEERVVKRFVIYLEHLQELNLSTKPSKNQAEIIKNTFALLNYEIESELMGNIVNRVVVSGRKEKICLDFITQVVEQFQSHRSVQYYADSLFVSRKYLSRVVKEVTGMSPLQIIEQTLMAEVTAKLRSNFYSISEIMQQLNFSDLPTFSKFFKKNMGQSPVLYRKELLS